MQKLNTRSQKIKFVKKLKKQTTSQQLSSSYLIMLSPFFFFRVGALLNKSEFFSSKLRVQKRFSYIIRGIVIHKY